jgi:hypothetical protein
VTQPEIRRRVLSAQRTIVKKIELIEKGGEDGGLVARAHPFRNHADRFRPA